MPIQYLTVRQMIQLAPDLFCASRLFLMTERSLSDLIRRSRL